SIFTMHKLFSLIRPTKVSDLCAAAFSWKAITARLHADGIHDVAEVLVDGSVAYTTGCAGIGGCNRALITARTFAISTIKFRHTIMEIHNVTGLEIPATTARLNDGHVIEVVGISVR